MPSEPTYGGKVTVRSVGSPIEVRQGKSCILMSPSVALRVSEEIATVAKQQQGQFTQEGVTEDE